MYFFKKLCVKERVGHYGRGDFIEGDFREEESP